jgi:DNA invertase Pin-like site-specific DNA recombinase
MRILAPIRLSRDTDTTNSPAMQRASITDYAAEHGHEVIWTDVEDIGVSGAVPIRERPGIGPWLAPGRLGQWDAICGHEMDRISRDLLDYLLFAQDMTRLGKVVIDISDGTDTSTPRGRQILEDRIIAAQRERQRMSERRAKAARRIANAGRWGGGRVPYGYAYLPVPGGFRLRQHDTNAAIAKRMVADAIGGKGLNTIAGELNAEGIPSPIGRPWRDNAVRRVLVSPALMGHLVQMKGSVIATRRDNAGQPISFTDEPLITADEFSDLQRAIQGRARARGQAQARHMLWGVAFCGECSGKFYGHRRHKHAGKRNYYSCRNCSGMSARLEDLDDLVTRLLITDAGDRVVHEQRLIPGDDHAAEIAKLERRAERLRSELADEHDDDLASALRRLERRIETLKADHEPDQLVWVPVESGETVAQMWARLDGDTEAKNKVLRDGGAEFRLNRDGSWKFRSVWVEADGDRFLKR